MLEVGQSIRLPADPKDLTRDLALKCCAEPDVIVQEFARLAHHNTHPQHKTKRDSVLAEAVKNAS